MKTTMYIIRHAQAEGNLYRRCHGWYDSLITDAGYQQIAALEKRLSGMRVDAVYSSDLFRTQTTAQAAARSRGLKIGLCPALREIHMGRWEDHTWAELDRFEHRELLRFNMSDPTWSAPGGEGCREVGERMAKCVLDIAARHPGESVAVFSHGTAIRCLLATLRGVPAEKWREQGHSDNTAISMLEVEEGRVKVCYADDNSHLPPELSTLAKQTWWQEPEKEHPPEGLYYLPLDLKKEGAFYREAHREAWETAYGTLEGYCGEKFLESALTQAEKDPRALQAAYFGEEPAGILQLDLERDARQGVGHISFLCVLPRYRGRGLGVQMLGEAVSVCRSLERERLHLFCAEKNQAAGRFYRRWGFRPVRRMEGAHGALELLEKSIGLPGGGVGRGGEK